MKLVVINQKGGVGKSTVCVNLSYGLTQLNKTVLLIDVDPQAHSSIIYHADYKLPVGTVPESEPKTAKDLFLNKNLDIQETIYPSYIDGQEVKNLKIIPSNIHLATVAEQITARTHREKILEKHLKKVEKDFNYLIVDCPPNLGVLTVNAIYTADLIIIPTIYAKYSLDGIADLFNTISDVKESENYQYMILRNLYDSRNKQTNQFIDEQLENFKNNLFKTIIRKTESINQAQINEEPVFTFDTKSNGVEDFNLLSKEIIKNG